VSPAAPAAAAPRIRHIRPQAGPQELILQTPADIGIIGGSLFGGKSWSLVIEPLRHVRVPGFNFVVFRRTMPEITNPGGLWEETEKWYYAAGGEPRLHVHEWDFADGRVTGKFAGLQFENDVDLWKGAQICLLIFDQLESFTERQFFTMLSRNRSTCGVEPYVRGSVNPDPDSFVATFLGWWIDVDGWAIPARSGVIRWFIKVNDQVEWSTVTCAPESYAAYDTQKIAAVAELEARFPGQAQTEGGIALAKSVTFVLARLQDNVIGRTINPTYEANVRSMAGWERERLLGGDRGGNWKARPTAGKVFNRAWFKTTLHALPTGDIVRWVRYWDKAGTQDGGKYSAGVLMAQLRDKRVLIVDVERGQWSALNRETVIKQKADADRQTFGDVDIWVEQEPGSGGKESAEASVRNLAGHTVRVDKVTGDKVTRANPLSAQAEAGNVLLMAGSWTEAFLKEAHSFDGVHGYSDQIDAAAGAFNKLTLGPAPARTIRVVGG